MACPDCKQESPDCIAPGGKLCLKEQLRLAQLQVEEYRKALEFAYKRLNDTVTAGYDVCAELSKVLAQTLTKKPLCEVCGLGGEHKHPGAEKPKNESERCAICGGRKGGGPFSGENKEFCWCIEKPKSEGIPDRFWTGGCEIHHAVNCPTCTEKRKDELTAGKCPECGLGIRGQDPLCDKHYSEYLGQNRARGNGPGD